MKFLLDESVDVRVAEYLTNLGHDVTAVAEHYQRSIPDTQVLAIARREQRILITNDRDFGELVFRALQPHTGVIYLRLGTFKLAPIVTRLSDVLQQFAASLDQFLVVTPHRVRIGRLPQR